MQISDRNNTIMAIHKETAAPIWECTKAHDIAIEYIKLRSFMGDHPERCLPDEYELVKKERVGIAKNCGTCKHIYTEHCKGCHYDWQIDGNTHWEVNYNASSN